MKQDPIVAEVRRIREAYAAQFDFDLGALAEDLKSREAKSDRLLVTLPPRPPTGDRSCSIRAATGTGRPGKSRWTAAACGRSRHRIRA